MIDLPIEAHLMLLLRIQDSVTLDDVCWWHAARALRAIRAAHLVADGDAWRPTNCTDEWMMRTWRRLRAAEPEIPAGMASDFIRLAKARRKEMARRAASARHAKAMA